MSLLPALVFGATAGVALVVRLLLHELRAFGSMLTMYPIRHPMPGGGLALPRWLMRLAGFDPADADRAFADRAEAVESREGERS